MVSKSLVNIWEAAEHLAGRHLPAPFWAYPWPGGVALARVLLDAPAIVAGLRVVDIGCGGGVAALAAARAGAALRGRHDTPGNAATAAGKLRRHRPRRSHDARRERVAGVAAGPAAAALR